MTEYKIVLYYEKPMPEFFQNSMETMLKRGVEQGFITGYEFEKRELDKANNVKVRIKKDADKIIKRYEEGIQKAVDAPVRERPELPTFLKESKEDERKPVQDNTSGLDTRAEKGTEELRGERKPGKVGSEHKKVRSDKSDNRKKGGK